jgi:hypothetical protein
MQALGQYALRIGTANLWLTMVTKKMVYERDETRELCGKNRCVEELERRIEAGSCRTGGRGGEEAVAQRSRSLAATRRRLSGGNVRTTVTVRGRGQWFLVHELTLLVLCKIH